MVCRFEIWTSATQFAFLQIEKFFDRFRNREQANMESEQHALQHKRHYIVIMGIILGVFVTLSSVGAGAFGIMALIGIITAISAMNQSLKENFSFMGANAFTIRYKEMNARMGGPQQGDEFSKTKKGQKEKKSNLDKPFKLEESVYFKENYGFNRAQVSVYRRGNGNNELRYKNYKTNPQVLYGCLLQLFQLLHFELYKLGKSRIGEVVLFQ